MAGSPPNLHTMVPTWARIQNVLKVKVKSKVTWYGHFCDFTKITSYHRQMAGTLPNLHMVVIQGVPRSRSRSKVTWNGHFCDVTKCLLYSTFWHSVSTCTHFMKHHYTLLPVPYKCQAAGRSVYIMHTPSLTVWLHISTCQVAVNMVYKLALYIYNI